MQLGISHRITESNGRRPPFVSILSCYQMLRAPFLVLVTCAVFRRPDQPWGPSGFWELYYVASNGFPPTSVVPFVLAIYAMAIGIGLFQMRKWALRVQILAAGGGALMWIRYFAADSILRGTAIASGRSLRPGFERTSAIMLASVEILIIVGLMSSRGEIPGRSGTSPTPP